MRQSVNILANTSPPGVKNLKTDHANSGLIIQPEFYFANGPAVSTNKQVGIHPFDRGTGDSGLIRIPWQSVDSAGNGSDIQITSLTDPWTLDLATSTINLTTRLGGLIDGLALTANMPYMIWAFFEQGNLNSIFQGFGLTRYPACAYTTHSGGTKGSSTLFTLAGTNENRGFRFVVGGRCLVREGILPTSPYNQGTITARAINSITLLLDNKAEYGTNLTAATAGTFQQFKPQSPLMPDTGLLYPATGLITTQFSYRYMGMIQTDNSSDVGTQRHIGDPYRFIMTPDPTFYSFTGGGTDTGQRTLARYLPLGPYSAAILQAVERGAGAGQVTVFTARDASASNQIFSDDVTTLGSESRINATLPMRSRDASLFTSVIATGSATAIANFVIQGYDNWEY